MPAAARRSQRRKTAAEARRPPSAAGEVARGLTEDRAPQRWVPTGYMRKAMRFMLERGAAGLFLDPGLRKTSITLAVIKILKAELRGVPFLVIAPLRVCHMVWPKEAKKWLEFRDLRVEVLHGDGAGGAPDKDEVFDGLLGPDPADVYCVNPEGIEWLTRRLAAAHEFPFFGLVVDESTAFKRSTGERYKMLRPLLPLFRRRYILTGTPSPNGLLDLFGQIYLLDLGNALGRWITRYRQEFFYPTGFGGYTWLPQDGAEDRIYERLAPLVLRMDAEDHLELPPLRGMLGGRGDPHLIEVELPPKARRVYDELEEFLITQLNREVVTAMNAGVASMKCSQVANGGLWVDRRENRWKKVHDAKTDAVEEFLSEVSHPTLVAVDFHHDAERLVARLGKKTPYIGRGISMKEAKRVEAAWNAGDVPVLLMSSATPHGLNMQERGRFVLWHSLTWNWELYDQFIRRVFRSGVSGTVGVAHLVARDTVDEAKVAALLLKGSDQRRLFEALKAYANRRRAKKTL